MSSRDAEPEVVSPPDASHLETDTSELTDARAAYLGELEVRRLLPLRHRRTVGAWCFVDHYGPTSVDAGPAMQVPPHPHIGLQTVTWLLDGEVLHRDNLGTEQPIRPAQLNLMTAGHGIAHSEQSRDHDDAALHGLQLWIALPDTWRDVAPTFEHHPELPQVAVGGFDATVLVGVFGGAKSPARTYSRIVGVDLVARHETPAEIPVVASHEHAILVTRRAAVVEGRPIQPGRLLYLGTGRESIGISASSGSRLFLLGGEPFDEKIIMWWNFVGRTPDDIANATHDWNTGQRFGHLDGYNGAPLTAPPMDTTRLLAR